MERRKWLISLRLRENASQQKIADKVGVSQQMYAAIETGKRRPSPEVAKSIASILGFDWTMFFPDKCEADSAGETTHSA